MITTQWAAVKRAVRMEADRVLAEYAKARDSVLAKCGQDISRNRYGYGLSLGRGTCGGHWPHVYVYTGGERPILKIDIGPAAYSAAELEPGQHWPGSLRRWESALAILIATDAAAIVAAWEQAEQQE